MKCRNCKKEFFDILKHLRKNTVCQSDYDMDNLVLERKLRRNEKQRNLMKDNYRENREDVLEKRKKYYNENKDKICQKMADRKGLISQRKRFKKFFPENAVKSYLTEQQEHLYDHSEGFCQPLTMKYLNHSVESYDVVCENCREPTAVKIIGINRSVCLKCNKAHCFVCKTEVSPDPHLGPLHFWPAGFPLEFIPGFCPLYSISPSDHAAVNCIINKKDCRMCTVIKMNYPEYDLFCDTETESILCSFIDFQRLEVQKYKCNLCSTKMNFVCEFDHHMRNHSKYGNQIAIIGFKSTIHEKLKRGHLEIKNAALIENEFMKVGGVVAVLAIFWKDHMQDFFKGHSLADIDIGVALIVNHREVISTEFLSVSFNKELIENLKVFVVKPHHIPDSRSLFDSEEYRRKSFEELFRWSEPSVQFCKLIPKTKLYERNTALLTTRCSLTYPNDKYPSGDHSYLVKHLEIEKWESFLPYVRKFLWNKVKHSDLCCCISKFYCITSTTLERCAEGCCGKCSSVLEEFSSDSDISTESNTDSDMNTESNTDSDADESSVKNSSESEDHFAYVSS